LLYLLIRLKTNLKNWQINDSVNLERGLKLGDRLDGHIVQGHVDEVGYLIAGGLNSGIIKHEGRSWWVSEDEKMVGLEKLPAAGSGQRWVGGGQAEDVSLWGRRRMSDCLLFRSV
jgi:hypothetical protein